MEVHQRRIWQVQWCRLYQGTPFAVEPDATEKTVCIANMMHAQMHHPMLSEKPDVTCPSDVQDSERRKEVVLMKKVQVILSPRRRTPLTRSRTSQSRPRAFLSRPSQLQHRLGQREENACCLLRRDREFLAEYGDH